MLGNESKGFFLPRPKQRLRPLATTLVAQVKMHGSQSLTKIDRSGRMIPVGLETFRCARTAATKAISLQAWPPNCLRILSLPGMAGDSPLLPLASEMRYLRTKGDCKKGRAIQKHPRVEIAMGTRTMMEVFGWGKLPKIHSTSVSNVTQKRETL